MYSTSKRPLIFFSTTKPSVSQSSLDLPHPYTIPTFRRNILQKTPNHGPNITVIADSPSSPLTKRGRASVASFTEESPGPPTALSNEALSIYNAMAQLESTNGINPPPISIPLPTTAQQAPGPPIHEEEGLPLN